VHDGQVEDRVRAVLRAEGDALPLTITAEELERRLALRQRERTGRRLSLVAAAVGVAVIGSLAATANGWLSLPGVGAPPETSTSPGVPSLEPSTGPNTGLPCSTIEPDENDQPPGIIIGVTPGDAIAHGGALGAYQLGERRSGEAGDWTSIDPAGLEIIRAGPLTERLEVLASNPDACLTGLVVDAVPFGLIDEPALSVADLTVAPTRVIVFGKPQPGDWLVRVRVWFGTATDAPAWSESFFHVLVPDRSATAATPPESLPAFGTPPGTVLVDEASGSDRPTEPTGAIATTTAGPVPPRGEYQVDVACLGFAPLRWSIGIEGQLDFLAAADEACDGTPGRHVVTLGLPTADLPIVVQADPGSAWHIVVSTLTDEPSFIPPALRMIETGNTEGSAGAAQGFGRCISIAGANDQCAGEWFTLDGVRPILVPARSRLTFALQDGWRIDQARITAAVVDEVRANSFAPEYSVGFVESGGPQITVPVDLGRGSWIIRVALNATKDSGSFGAYYDLALVIE